MSNSKIDERLSLASFVVLVRRSFYWESYGTIDFHKHKRGIFVNPFRSIDFLELVVSHAHCNLNIFQFINFIRVG